MTWTLDTSKTEVPKVVVHEPDTTMTWTLDTTKTKDPEMVVHVPVVLLPIPNALRLILPRGPSSDQSSCTLADLMVSHPNVMFDECLIDLEHLAKQIEHQTLYYKHLVDVIGIAAQNSPEALRMILATKKVRYHPFAAAMILVRHKGLFSTKTPEQREKYAEDFETLFFDQLVKLSGFADVHRTRQLRDAFQKLEFRSLRQAYRPGLAAAKRALKEFKKEFAEKDVEDAAEE